MFHKLVSIVIHNEHNILTFRGLNLKVGILPCFLIINNIKCSFKKIALNQYRNLRADRDINEIRHIYEEFDKDPGNVAFVG